MEIHRYAISSIDDSVQGTKIFRLEPADGGMGPFVPGQFVFLHILDAQGASQLKRAYSIASSPSAPYLEFAIDMLGGQMTSLLDKMKAGDAIGVEGPVGHMVYKDERRAAFLAGGTGVAPFMSMLRHIAEKKLEGEFVLCYSVRTADRILFREELARLQRENPSIKVVVTLTREDPAGWKGERGRMSCSMLGRHVSDPKSFDWWLCGSKEMMKSMRECIEGMGVDKKRIRLEGW